MDRRRSEVLKLLILSAWISAAGGAAFNTRIGAKCEDENTIGCLPTRLVGTFGKPASRRQVKSRFRVKSRKNSNSDEPGIRKREEEWGDDSHHSAPLTGLVEVEGNPEKAFYDVSNSKLPHLDPSKKVVVIVHGWSVGNQKIQENYRNESINTVEMGKWVGHLQEQILQYDDVNVVIHDWRSGALHGYTESRHNTWTAAADLYTFLKSLIESRGIDASNIHLIGHSLGCHVSGMAGKRMIKELNTQIGRISALDPAAPNYYDAPDEVRLTKSDASLVDVYHTDGGSAVLPCGLYDALGDIDFYPNNGTDQPSCHLIKDPTISQVYVDELCDHMISSEYFIKSISRETDAIQCDSYEDFKAGKCINCRRNGCLRVGYFMDKGNKKINFKNEIQKDNLDGKYFYETSAETDFCAKTLIFQVQWSRRMKRQLKKKKKFGPNSKLIFTISGEKEDKIFEGEDVDQIISTNDKRAKTENYVRVESFPCSTHPLPVKNIKVELIQDCNSDVSARNIFSNIFSGGCSPLKLFIRRIKVLQINTDQYAESFLPFRKSDNSQTVWLGSKLSRHQ